jgi:hypothetical protein
VRPGRELLAELTFYVASVNDGCAERHAPIHVSSDSVWFQLGRDGGDGFVFLLDTRDRTGEMRIGDFSHAYLEELDWRRSSKTVFRSLSAATLHAAKQIASDLV